MSATAWEPTTSSSASGVISPAPPSALWNGALLCGDIVQVVPGRGWVSFMYSYPNLIPLPAGEVRRMRGVLATLEFDRVYGAWWDRVMLEEAKAGVLRSADRYLAALARDTPGSAEPAVLSAMLIVADASEAVGWYRSALGATELWNLGSVAALTIEGAPFLVHEAVPGRTGERAPAEAGLTTTRIELFVDDAGALIERAQLGGATRVEAPVARRAPWGVHRQGGFTDPVGHRWSVGDRTPLEPFGR